MAETVRTIQRFPSPLFEQLQRIGYQMFIEDLVQLSPVFPLRALSPSLVENVSIWQGARSLRCPCALIARSFDLFF